MPSTDWPQVDTIPPMVSSSDLFDGDILGDELIDIYNAAVVGGGVDSINEIPSLLSTSVENKKETADEGHPGTQMAVAAAAIDDGLGAFRPSTSFNDLTTFLPPSTTSVGIVSTPTLTPVASSTTLEQPSKTPSSSTKKRGVGSAPSETPMSKRRANGNKRNPSGGVTSAKKPKANASTIKDKALTFIDTVSSLEHAGNDTPNPLCFGGTPPPGSVKTPPSVKNGVPCSFSSTPAVVSPRACSKVESQTDSHPTADPGPNLPGAATEADFKSVAQAAVTSLIINAGAVSKTETGPGPSSSVSSKVDTSTEHIKALTGSNWVAVCTGGGEMDQVVAATTGDKVNNRARRQNLTADERARQNRDRNREHARNTRLRKKAYVEELKRTLTELVSQRDAAEVEKRHTAQRELEQREVRFRVIEEFLKLRGRNEGNFARWAAILEDNFSFTIPISSFQKTSTSNNQEPGKDNLEQVLTGVSETMADSSRFSAFLQSLGYDSNVQRGNVTFVYDCDRKNFFMDCCNAVMYWTASSSGLSRKGVVDELKLKGSFHATFCPASNKLISGNILFDTGILLSQVHLESLGLKRNEETCDEVAAAAAAEVAASEADAILDSLQMPHIETTVPANVNVVPVSCSGSSSGASITSLDKEDSSDESIADGADGPRGAPMSKPNTGLGGKNPRGC